VNLFGFESDSVRGLDDISVGVLVIARPVVWALRPAGEWCLVRFWCNSNVSEGNIHRTLVVWTTRGRVLFVVEQCSGLIDVQGRGVLGNTTTIQTLPLDASNNLLLLLFVFLFVVYDSLWHV
jgi:hypothetical protein